MCQINPLEEKRTKLKHRFFKIVFEAEKKYQYEASCMYFLLCFTLIYSHTDIIIDIFNPAFFSGGFLTAVEYLKEEWFVLHPLWASSYFFHFSHALSVTVINQELKEEE